VQNFKHFVIWSPSSFRSIPTLGHTETDSPRGRTGTEDWYPRLPSYC